MSMSDWYAARVERHKHEDIEGHWWWMDNGIIIEGPYDTEEELDKVLWEMALDGDALPSAP